MAKIVKGKFAETDVFMINQIDTGFLSREPGVMVMNSLNNIDGNRTFPIGIVNNTSNTFSLKEGNVVAKVSLVLENEVSETLSYPPNNSEGIIRPSRSSWSATVVIVSKRNGGDRFCIDYRKLNDVTSKFNWPLPHIDDLLSSLYGGMCFSLIDLRAGFWQVPVKESDKSKSAFVCHKGLFEFNMMPFGMSNSPSIYSELMTAVLEGINGKFSAAYMDDIIIWSETPQGHLVHLQPVFDRLESAGLKLKRSKCKFFQTELKYLGHINSKGIRPDPEKIRVIVDLAPPESVKEIRSFVGMCSF